MGRKQNPSAAPSWERIKAAPACYLGNLVANELKPEGLRGS
jgi:hypothetical protein